jgi:signal transduction histidine kinase/ActR/RegA family two-component response regulator
VTFPLPDPLRQRVLMLLPTARDAALTHELLGRSGIDSHICASATELQVELARGVGVMLIGDECLPGGGAQVLAQYLDDQPRWSDLPVLVLARGGVDSVEAGDAVAMLGNVTLLERPLRVAALVSAVHAASRARKRQYEIETHLRELEQARDAKTQAVKRKDEFLAMLAHELRNPLAPIRNALHVLSIDDNDPERRLLLRSMMERQVDHMVRLVDDLLEASRLSRGMITLHRERIDLRTAVRSAIEQSQPLIDAGRHSLRVELPEMPVPVDADPVRVAQVVGNLLNNAAKYGRQGGLIAVSLRLDGDAAKVQVDDDGIGIDDALLPQVFDLFTQGERATHGVQDGLGIGLALVRTLVELHGGSVAARSKGKGKGASFVVRLPLAASPVATTTMQAPTANHGSRAHGEVFRALVVDDNVDAANTLAMVLDTLGVERRVENDGASALRAADEFMPHVILLDIGMSGMDGYEVARRIRDNPRHAGVVLVAVTGWSHAPDRMRSHAAGFDHHLAKPVDIPALLTLLDLIRADAESPNAA